MPRDGAIDLDWPDTSTRLLAAIVGQNENGALRSFSRALLDSVKPYGFDGEVIDLNEAGWQGRLGDLLGRGLLLAWGPAGVGSHFMHEQVSFWDHVQVPFISVMADSPCQMPGNHFVRARFVGNGYVFRDFLEIQRRFVRSPQLATLLRQGIMANPGRDLVPWSERQYRMVFVKSGTAPERHRQGWAAWPPRLRAIVEDCAAEALRTGVGDITPAFLASAEHHGLVLDGRTDVLFGLMYAADIYVRDVRSTNMARALLRLPVDIIGRGWDHLISGSDRARFHDPVDADTLPLLFANTQYLVSTTPNHSDGTHERVLYGFAARAAVVTNENQFMRDAFGDLDTYVPVDTEAETLADHLASIHGGSRALDDGTDAALARVERDFSAARFMHALMQFGQEIRAAAQFAPFAPS